MPAEKVCKRIGKANPTICEVKFAVKTATMSEDAVKKLRVKQLKTVLSDRGVECIGCTEKTDYVQRVIETAHMAEL
jgi:hypothetical protein